jgi:16S rRNA processing protein RimM
MQSISKESLANIGFISKPLGFKGELIFALETGGADEYAGTTFFFVELEGKPVPFLVEDIRLNGDNMIVKLEDINSEAEARILSGKKVFVEDSGIVSSESDIEWKSLIGFQVIDLAYGELGLLEGIEEYPQQVIARCTVNGKEILFPLNENLISSIDDEKKEIHLDLPEGLLDVYLK